MDFVISPYWCISYSRFCNRLLLFSLQLLDVGSIHGSPISSAVGEILLYLRLVDFEDGRYLFHVLVVNSHLAGFLQIVHDEGFVLGTHVGHYLFVGFHGEGYLPYGVEVQHLLNLFGCQVGIQSVQELLTDGCWLRRVRNHLALQC